MKTNAKEYLIEFAEDKPMWLKALIYETIESNGNLSDEKKSDIYKVLINDEQIQSAVPNIDTTHNPNPIIFKTLIHKKGVNALEKNQTIKFQKDVTILYGMNGVGKSSYFKILNEIVGGNQKKEILSNIYSDNPEEIEVEITYQEGSTLKDPIQWNGTTRSFDTLNSSKVFDTSYLNGLLDKRAADETLITPLGLHLFEYLIGIIDEFKNKLVDEADDKKQAKPCIDTKALSLPFQTVFTNHIYNQSEKAKIISLMNFDEQRVLKLQEIVEEINKLKQVNIQDKIKLIRIEINNFSNLKNDLKQKKLNLDQYIKQTDSLLNMYITKKKANNEARNQFEVLNSIPGSNTKEWKDFIIAGNRYSEKSYSDKSICPYCFQPLKEVKSLEIVRAYSLFLKDTTEKELNDITNKCTALINGIKRQVFEISISDNFDNVLGAVELDHKRLSDIVKTIVEYFVASKEALIMKIENRDNESQVEVYDLNDLLDFFDKKIADLESKIEVYSAKDEDKRKKINSFEDEKKVLLENKSIYEQKDSINKWFEIDIHEKSLRRKASELNTRQLSNQSRTAHNELLTESLQVSFQNELKAIGYPNLDVNLETAGIRKGISNTKLSLINSDDLQAVLSEGEQKAVALALFIAEIKLQNSTNPIILDDPVNSLDHKIASNFANRLLELDNQIIIFNHNRLFLDAFETSKDNHVCRTIDTDCSKNKGKHIRIYKVVSNGKNTKGILLDYKKDNSITFIEESKRLLLIRPFDNELKVANNIRLAVECIIDEIIFNRQVPTKYSNKNNHINWSELKKLNNDDNIISCLERIHSRVSGGEMHNGSERAENPIEFDEFNQMVIDLEGIIST